MLFTTVTFLRNSSAQQPPTIETLSANGSTTIRQLAKDTTQQFSLQLQQNQFVDVVITKGDLNLTARVFDPANTLLVEFTSKQYEPLYLPIESRQSGTYRLEIKSLEVRDSPATYQLTIPRPLKLSPETLKISNARQLVMQSSALLSGWEEASLRTSITKLSDAAKLWHELRRSSDEAKTLVSLGDIHFSLSEYKQAQQAYTEAAGTRDTAVRYRALVRVAYVYVYLSQNARALEMAERALAYYQTGEAAANPDYKRDEAEAQNTAGEAAYSTGRMSRASAFFARALTLADAAGDRRSQALIHLNLAYCYSDSGDLPKARKSVEAALSSSRELKNTRGEALALTAYGTIQSFWGEKQSALDNHTRAMEKFRSIGDHGGEGVALNSIGKVYEDLNESPTAIDKYQQALDIFHGLGNTEFEAVARFYLGRVHRSLNENEIAREFFDKSLQQSRQVGQRRLEAFALTALSGLRSSEGLFDEALAGLNRVLRMYRETSDRRGQANVLTEIARIYQNKNDPRRALEYFKQALPLTQITQDRNAEANLLYEIAYAERSLGDLEGALYDITESTQVIASLRAQIVSPELRASYFASVQKYAALRVDILMKLDRLKPEKQYAVHAFELNDNTRAQSLLETISESQAKIRRGIDHELVARERELQEQLTARATLHMHALNRSDKEESDRAEKELRQLTQAYHDVETEIRRQSPHYATLTNPPPLKLAEIQAELQDPNIILLEYSLDTERSYVWAVTANSFAAFSLPAASEIEALAEDVNNSLIARQTLAENGAVDVEAQAASSDAAGRVARTKLSEMILGPVASLIVGKKVIVVTDGKLQYIPFDSLPAPGSSADSQDEPPPLMTTNEVSYLSSASLIAVIRKWATPSNASDRLVAIVADPVFDPNDPRVVVKDQKSLANAADAGGASESSNYQNSALRDIVAPGSSRYPRLLGTRQEAEGIMSVTPSGSGLVAMDFNAGRNIISDGQLGQYKVVHFATHGVVNTLHPELSGILLSLVNASGQSEDGFLQLHDIYNLDLSNTQLVVLSACRTALGKDIKGEGFVGLTRGFMYAGSKSVIASLWKVDDRATAELMKHFYRGLFDEGLTPSAALRKAKEAMWRQPRWRAPYYWAAFELQGEYRDVVEVPPRSQMPLIVAAGAVVASLLAAVFLLRRRRLKSVT